LEQTTNLKMPFIMPSQAQKHVTHNEALLALDVVVQLSVLDRHLATPPALPVEGDRYIVAAAATGGWTGKSGQVAAWQDGVWAFQIPVKGWLAWVADEQRLFAYDGTFWLDAIALGINPASMVGINTTADATNRLSVKSQAVLFDNQGSGQQVKINKAAAGDNASLLFQTGYSGRTEFGLAGDDDWHVKVSADGSAWTEALKVSRSDGRVLLPAGLSLTDQNQAVAKRHVRELLIANRTYYVRTDGSNSNTGLVNNAGGAFLTIQKAVDTAAALDLSIFNVTIQVGAGIYSEAISFKSYVGVGPITIQGDLTTPSNVTSSLTTGFNFSAVNVTGRWRVAGIKLTNTGNFIAGINCENSMIEWSSIEFGAFSGTASFHMQAGVGGVLKSYGNYGISGGAVAHIYATLGAVISNIGRMITLTGTPAFSNWFAGVFSGSLLQINGNTFSGTATGTRYSVTTNSVIDTNGGGASYLPGGTSGSVGTGGQYV
jgi:hypothetical protein